jgi:hypothetical protein
MEMNSPGFVRRVACEGTSVVLIAAAGTVWARLGGPITARALRRGFAALDPVFVLEVAAALTLVGVGALLAGAAVRERAAARIGPLCQRLDRLLARVPTSTALSAIVTLVAVFRVSLGASNHSPKVLGDELVYTGLAKGWALHDQPMLRGAHDLGYSTLYPLFLAPAFRLAADGAGALASVRVMNAIAVALTAVPAYVLARRVVTRGWALGVAALTVMVPWTAYAALTMTESLFYPVFVGYAAVLAWTLERPTWWRQAAMLATLAVLVGIRAQGLTVALATLAAVLLHGALSHHVGAAVRRFSPTFVVLAIVLAIGLAAKAAGVAVPTSSYNAVFGSFSRLGGMVKWGAWSIASFELALGVVALAALPVALRGMLRPEATPRARSTGIVAMMIGLSLLGSVALLSASPFGLHVLHERNLFYVTPLVLTCFAHWLWRGLERPLLLTVISAAAAVALAAVLSPHVVLHSNEVDLASSNFFNALAEQTPGVHFRVWSIALGIAGVATFLLAKRPLFPVVSLVIAFAAVTVRTDYRDTLTTTQARALAWIDHSLPGGAEATVVYLGLAYSGAPCAQVAAAEEQDLTIWTEFFNVRVEAVRHVYVPNPRDGLASAALTVGDGGLILDRGRPFGPAYVVIDSRQPIVGTRLLRFDLSSIHSEYQNGASLTLWLVDAPLRFYPRPEPLPPRADGAGC